MTALAEPMMLATCLIAIYVGLRTLWIFTRTHGIQEFAIGVNVLSIAVGGGVLTVLSVLGRTDGDVYDSAVYKTGLGFLALHLVAIYAGTWKIFHPDSRLIGSFCLLMLVPIGIWYYAATEHVGTVWMRPVLFQVLRGVGMTWSAFECFHYSDRLHRQATLGLVEPMMAHRFWLWAMGATSALVVCTLELMGWGLSEASFSGPPLGLTVVAALGLAGSMSVALAFFPPAAYARRVMPLLGGAHPVSRPAGASSD